MRDEVAFEYRVCEGILPMGIGQFAVVERCSDDAHERLVYALRYAILLRSVGGRCDVGDSPGLEL